MRLTMSLPANDMNLKFPEWQAPLQDLILEFDRDTMLRKVPEVETLIFERLRDLSRDGDAHDERCALNDALSVIRVLKRDRLGCTDGK
jgi:hypothetical protein